DSVTVDLRGGGRGTYARVRDRVALRAEAGYAVVDAAGARVLCEGEAAASAQGDVYRGEYDGRGRDLIRPSRDRHLFVAAAHAEAGCAVVGAAGARVLCEGEAAASAEGDVYRGEYDGRVRDLILPSRDRHLFDAAAQAEAEREVERRLQGRLADDLARRVYDC